MSPPARSAASCAAAPLLALAACLSCPSCSSPASVSTPESTPEPGTCPVQSAVPADEWLRPDEVHLAHLWKVTSGGENAEGYFSFAGDRLSLQRRQEGESCDRIYVTGPDGLEPISSGRGVTTCSYFFPDGRRVLFASTQFHHAECPPPTDFSEGYVWRVFPEYDIWSHDLETGAEHPLTSQWGYDAEATISPRGDRIVFTSTRSGDLELWTCDLDGSALFQVTDSLGYDGGGFFSHDGRRIVFRTTQFTPEGGEEELETYRRLLADWKVRPHSMEIMLIDADGTNRVQLTNLGGASFAPFFFPDDRRVIFSTNHHEESARNFDLFAIGVDGTGLERITTYEGFDSFPMFSPDGRYLAFASNRGGDEDGETNLFIAEWR